MAYDKSLYYDNIKKIRESLIELRRLAESLTSVIEEPTCGEPQLELASKFLTDRVHAYCDSRLRRDEIDDGKPYMLSEYLYMFNLNNIADCILQDYIGDYMRSIYSGIKRPYNYASVINIIGDMEPLLEYLGSVGFVENN